MFIALADTPGHIYVKNMPDIRRKPPPYKVHSKAKWTLEAATRIAVWLNRCTDCPMNLYAYCFKRLCLLNHRALGSQDATWDWFIYAFRAAFTPFHGQSGDSYTLCRGLLERSIYCRKALVQGVESFLIIASTWTRNAVSNYCRNRCLITERKHTVH